jgi:hypothetical protein
MRFPHRHLLRKKLIADVKRIRIRTAWIEGGSRTVDGGWVVHMLSYLRSVDPAAASHASSF